MQDPIHNRKKKSIKNQTFLWGKGDVKFTKDLTGIDRKRLISNKTVEIFKNNLCLSIKSFTKVWES